MSLNLLGKNRPIFFDNTKPCAQLVQFPEISAIGRCAFCHYQEPFRQIHDWTECYEKRGCGRHDLLFMPMVTDAFGSGGSAQHFSYTPFFKQHTIGYVKRYLQLLQCRLSGYECNSLCQFYPARIDEGKTVAECASSHACGRNGSFWTLLTPKYTMVWNWPSKLAPDDPPYPIVFLDGTQLYDVTVDDITRASNGKLRVHLSNQTWYYVANFWGESHMAGYMLETPNISYPELWHPGTTLFSQEEVSEVVLAYWPVEPIGRALLTAGMPDDNFIYAMKDLTLVQITSSVSKYFYNNSTEFELLADGETYILSLKNARHTDKYVISFNANNTKLLGCKFEDYTPSSWSKVTRNGSLPSGHTVINLSSIHDSMSQWLMKIGVKSTLFNF